MGRQAKTPERLERLRAAIAVLREHHPKRLGVKR
jgi:hypothetical protein